MLLARHPPPADVQASQAQDFNPCPSPPPRKASALAHLMPSVKNAARKPPGAALPALGPVGYSGFMPPSPCLSSRWWHAQARAPSLALFPAVLLTLGMSGGNIYTQTPSVVYHTSFVTARVTPPQNTNAESKQGFLSNKSFYYQK